MMIGSIRQEVLSGIRAKEKFEEIRDLLKAFPSPPIEDSIYELAASFFYTCRRNGIKGSHTDYLICACSVAWEVRILSKDKDYQQYAKHIPIDVLEI